MAKAPGFGPLAIAYSEDQATRYKGGDVGWVEAARGPAWLSPTVRQAALASGVTAYMRAFMIRTVTRRRSAASYAPRSPRSPP